MVRTLSVALFTSLVLSGSASAQQPVDDFARLPERVEPGNVVIVVDEKGQGTKGKITDLSPTSLQIMTTGWRKRPISFSADQVQHVNRVDSRKNGFLIGAAIGAVPGIILGSLFNEYCYNEGASHCPVVIAFAGGATGLIGGWIGWGIDGAINGQERVYSKR